MPTQGLDMFDSQAFASLHAGVPGKGVVVALHFFNRVSSQVLFIANIIALLKSQLPAPPHRVAHKGISLKYVIFVADLKITSVVVA